MIKLTPWVTSPVMRIRYPANMSPKRNLTVSGLLSHDLDQSDGIWQPSLKSERMFAFEEFKLLYRRGLIEEGYFISSYVESLFRVQKLFTRGCLVCKHKKRRKE